MLVVVGMLIAYFGWRNHWAWPSALTWNSLSPHLDRFQNWLSNNRNVEHPNIVFRPLQLARELPRPPRLPG